MHKKNKDLFNTFFNEGCLYELYKICKGYTVARDYWMRICSEVRAKVLKSFSLAFKCIHKNPSALFGREE